MYLHDTAPKVSWRSQLKEKLFSFAYQSDLVRTGHGLWTKSLTVLNYHRIGDITRPDFDSFKPNVSANMENFALQMDYLLRWFNVVSMSDVTQWLDEKKTLPPHAALITFDDGYRDNYISAFPILKERNLPAIIFLTSGHIQQDIPFYWDLTAYCFHHTNHDTISFPDGRHRNWKNASEMGKISIDLIESLKLMPEDDKLTWIAHLPEKLNVSIPVGYFQNLMMNWEQVREMRAGGIEFGGHTMRHPILTRVSPERAKEEIVGSKTIIEKELGETILGFAYPNGGKVDFNDKIEALTAEAGYRAAFTLLNGPSSHREVKQSPYTIRRIFISHNHTLPIFSALVSGFNRYRPS